MRTSGVMYAVFPSMQSLLLALLVCVLSRPSLPLEIVVSCLSFFYFLVSSAALSSFSSFSSTSSFLILRSAYKKERGMGIENS